jgi:glycosyltransferase involved in cell wall biosynthesis
MYRAILATEARILPQLDGLVSVSQFMRAQLLQRIPALARVATTVIPNFASLPGTAAETIPPADLINIGTLEARKNQRYLLEVLQHARQRGRRYTLNLVGDGPDRALLESLVEKFGLHGQVRFLGARRDAARLLRQHRVYVHSASMESFGIVLIEAMACGLPVFAAPVGGIPEVFDDGAEGCYWPLNNPAQAAAILIAVLEQPRRMAAMAEAARRRYRQCYTPEVAAARLWQFLQGGISSGPVLA